MQEKICFIWVEKYRNLYDFCLNLDCTLTFSYEKNKNHLEHSEKIPLPDDFFPEQINEVTALVGKNGVGKSNALELICTVLKANNSDINFKYILIYKDESGLNCISNIDQKPTSDIQLNHRSTRSNKKLKVVFYSNVYAERSRRFVSGVVDISPDRMKRSSTPLTDSTTQLRRQLWFINSNVGFSETGIEPPTHISISLDSTFKPQDITRHREDTFTSFNSVYRKRIRNLDTESKFFCTLCLAYFTRFYFLLRRNLWENNELLDLILVGLEKSLVDILNRPPRDISFLLIDKVESIVVENELTLRPFILGNPGKINRETIQDQVNWLRKSTQWIPELNLREEDAERRSASGKTFHLIYNANSNKYIDHMLRAFELLPFFSMNWIGISSGQRAYLNLFSLIAHELRFATTSPVFLCIDEGDLYLHPQWQIEFFQRLLDVLQRSSKTKVQLLLTSHSPFLLADLPRQNIFVMPCDSDPERNNALHRETFGANIHDLYAGPLFINIFKTSLFAQNKISSLATAAQNPSISKAEKQTIKNTLRLVGDEMKRKIITRSLGDD